MFDDRKSKVFVKTVVVALLCEHCRVGVHFKGVIVLVLAQLVKILHHFGRECALMIIHVIVIYIYSLHDKAQVVYALKIYINGVERQLDWFPPELCWVKLNSDGAFASYMNVVA